MRIGILTGTRPDIIKMAPIYWESERRGHTPVLIHTGQHYSDHLFDGVYASMNLPAPKHRLDIGMCESPAQRTGLMITSLDQLLRKKEKGLDILLVHGDTLTAMAGALSAYLNLISVGHVEAGLRTFSHEPFPEQLDTRCADAASDIFFAATKTNKQNLLNEGFPDDRIHVVGNTIVDAARWAVGRGESGQAFFSERKVDFSKPLIYFSIHRRETTMDKERFTAAAQAAMRLAQNGYEVVWSLRPGTQSALKEHGLEAEVERTKGLHLITEIPSYPHIMFFINRCRFICTDSGSMQEEASALHIPCITIRYVTDRPESVETGANILAPPQSVERIMQAVTEVEKNYVTMRAAKNPYGDGDSAQQILDAIEGCKGSLVRWEHEEWERNHRRGNGPDDVVSP